jgi:hypothetical protein
MSSLKAKKKPSESPKTNRSLKGMMILLLAGLLWSLKPLENNIIRTGNALNELTTLFLKKIGPLFGKDTPGEVTDLVYGYEWWAVTVSSFLTAPVVFGQIGMGSVTRLPVPMEAFDCVGGTRQVIAKIALDISSRPGMENLRFVGLYTAKPQNDLWSDHNYVLVWDARDPVGTATIVDFWVNQDYMAIPLRKVFEEINRNPEGEYALLYNRIMPNTMGFLEAANVTTLPPETVSKWEDEAGDILTKVHQEVFGKGYS